MTISSVNILMLGAIAMGSITIAVQFLRFWQRGRDRFFLLFALSFLVQAVNRVALALSAHPSEGTPVYYLIRLVAFLLIAAAIIDKNRAPRAGAPVA